MTLLTVQLNLNFTHACMQAHVCACTLTHGKLQKLACARTVVHDFGISTWNSEYMQHARDACHEFALGLPHYICGVATGTVAVGNEMQLFCN